MFHVATVHYCSFTHLEYLDVVRFGNPDATVRCLHSQMNNNEQFFMFCWNIVKPQLTRVFFCHFCILLQFMTFRVVAPLAPVHGIQAHAPCTSAAERWFWSQTSRNYRAVRAGRMVRMVLWTWTCPLLLKGRSTLQVFKTDHQTGLRSCWTY